MLVDMLLEDATNISLEDDALLFGQALELVDRLGFEPKRELCESEFFVEFFAATWCRSAGMFRLRSELALLPLVDVIEKFVVLVVVAFGHGVFSGADVSPKKGGKATARLKGWYMECPNLLISMGNQCYIIRDRCTNVSIESAKIAAVREVKCVPHSKIGVIRRHSKERLLSICVYACFLSKRSPKMTTRRPGQKQLHAWIPEELKARLETWRDEHETTYTDIITEALEAHFQKEPDDDDLPGRMSRVEAQLGRVLELLEETADVDHEKGEPAAQEVESESIDQVDLDETGEMELPRPKDEPNPRRPQRRNSSGRIIRRGNE